MIKFIKYRVDGNKTFKGKGHRKQIMENLKKIYVYVYIRNCVLKEVQKIKIDTNIIIGYSYKKKKR